MTAASPAAPAELRTERLLLRPWRAADAAELLPILESNRDHLTPWIPARVAEPAPLPQLADRLAGFGADFAADRCWRYGVFASDMIDSHGGRMLGEVDLIPRDATKRVAFVDADRAELGYWLRSDAEGQGFVTEAAGALLSVAKAMPKFSRYEIRCDPRNARSGRVAERLGFTVESTTDDTQVWILSATLEIRLQSH